MSTDDIYQLIGAYAVDAVDDAEREFVEQYLRDNPEQAAEMRSLRDAAAELSVTTATEPPAGLRSAVLSQIAQVRPLPPEAPESTEAPEPAEEVAPEEPAASVAPVSDLGQARARRRRPVGSWLAAAAAAVILTGGIGTAIWSPWQDDSSVSIAQQVTEAPDAKSYTLKLGDHRATVTRSAGEGRAVLQSDDLAPPPAGKAYQMWLQQPDGHMEPAGLVPEIADDGSVTMVLDGDAKRAVGTGMTLEPAGGSQQPTTDPMGLVEF